VNTSYKVQANEGMQPLPEVTGSIASKYLGGGHGGYALYLFDNEKARNVSNLIRVEPYLK
jgi:galactokinase/mevalonate kinase-like predicted kinase